MLKPIVQILDRLAIATASASVWRECKHLPIVEGIPSEAVRTWLPAGEVPSPQLVFQDARRFEFPSPEGCPYPENRRVPGRLYRTNSAQGHRQAVLLLHGWDGELGYRVQFPWLARRLNARGYDVAMFELPFHGRRKPRDPKAPRNFLAPDSAHMIRAARQALLEARAMITWLLGDGCSSVFAWGFSLGGWLTGWLTCIEPRLQGAVLWTPVVRMDRAIRELPFCRLLRRSVAGSEHLLKAFRLDRGKPLIRPGDILLVEGLHDLIAPAEDIEALAEAWKGCELKRFPHGHISVLMSLNAFGQVLNWLDERR